MKFEEWWIQSGNKWGRYTMEKGWNAAHNALESKLQSAAPTNKQSESLLSEKIWKVIQSDLGPKMMVQFIRETLVEWEN